MKPKHPLSKLTNSEIESTFPSDFDLRHEHDRNMEDLLELVRMKSLYEGEDSGITDTYSCEYLFLEAFVTQDMYSDFPFIARDFLMHYYTTFEEQDYESIAEDGYSINTLPDCLQRKVLNMMFALAKKGEDYAVAMFVNLYRTYFRQEYRQLKKFRSLSISEATALATDKNDDFSIYKLARVLCMGRIMGISLSPDCKYIYLLMDKHLSDLDDNLSESSEPEETPNAVKEKANRMVNEWMSTVSNTHTQPKELEPYYHTHRFIMSALQDEYFARDYFLLSMLDTSPIEPKIKRTLELLMMKNPERDYSFAEVQIYSVIRELIKTITDVAYEVSESVDTVLGLPVDFSFEGDTCLYKPTDQNPHAGARSGLSSKKSPKDNPTDRKNSHAAVTSAYQAASPEEYSNEALLNEIEELRSKLRKKEQDYQHLRTMYTASMRQLDESAENLRQFEDDRRELIALREHVYNSAEKNFTPEEKDIEMMAASIAKLRIVIIGGHDNWTAKLRSRFRNWEFISPRVSGTVDTSFLKSADHIYFFTDFISHSTYLRYVHVIKECSLPFGYIHSINIENNIRQIYDEVECMS